MSAPELAWLGHSAVLAAGRLNVYIDPFELPPGLPKADVVLITHPHFDHCSERDVEGVATPQTVVAGPRECVARFRLNQLPMRPGERRRVLGLEVQALPAFVPEKPHHPREKGWLGFVVDFGGFRLYHAGDTLETDEMYGLEPDVALLPVDGLYTMTADVAAKAVERLRPKAAAPIHYGGFCGTRADAARFLRLCEERGVAAAALRERSARASPLPELSPGLAEAQPA